MKQILMISLLALGLSFSTSNASETVKGAKEDYKKFKKEMSIKLKEAEKKIEQLQAEGAEEVNEAKKETAKDLIVTKNKLKAELEDLKKDSKSTTAKWKADLAASINSLNDRIQKALKD